MSPGAGRSLALVAAVVAAGIGLVVLTPRLLGLAAGPESEVITQLKRSEVAQPELRVPGTQTPLRSTRHAYQRFSVLLDPDAGAIFVAATLDFDGRFGATHVGSLGVERVVFQRRDGDWVPVDGLAPTLVSVVSALEARRTALESMDEAKLRALLPPAERQGASFDAPELAELRRLRDRGYAVTAWYIRLDRDRAEVTEEYHLRGALPDRPVDSKGTRRLSLRKEGSEFYFWPGLM